MKEKVVLAYSGGLDTTAIIPWLKENFDYEVICVCIDCGQEEELDGLEERANFATNILFLVYRQMRFTRTNICWALLWLDH